MTHFDITLHAGDLQMKTLPAKSFQWIDVRSSKGQSRESIKETILGCVQGSRIFDRLHRFYLC